MLLQLNIATNCASGKTITINPAMSSSAQSSTAAAPGGELPVAMPYASDTTKKKKIISGTMPLINGQHDRMLNRIAKNTVFGDHHRAMTATNTSVATPAMRRPNRSRASASAAFHHDCLATGPPQLDQLIGDQSADERQKRSPRSPIDYQLSITLTCKEASMDFAASVLMPESSTVGGDNQSLAVKPQPAPAIAATEPATGCRPTARNVSAPSSGIITGAASEGMWLKRRSTAPYHWHHGR